jgi:glutaminase
MARPVLCMQCPDAGKGVARVLLAQPFIESLRTIHARVSAMDEGKVATYIPELAKADPDHLAIVIATLDGEVYAVGDADVEFTIQSISKPFAYAAALDRFGREETLTRVGVEPTGDAFNAIVLDEENRRPFNPMVNAGAIAVSALYAGDTQEARNEAMVATLSGFAGRRLAMDESVFRSEDETGHRNRAIAYLLLNSGMLVGEPAAALDTYFRQCSMLVNTRDLAMMAATLANGGINPLTRRRAVKVESVPDVLTVMLTCGMYDYAGQWAFEAGLPAKSGVAGGVLAVVPGQFGIAAYSPRLDRFGNSVRAVAACRELSAMFSFHSFRQRVGGNGLRTREWNGGDVRSRRWRPVAERAVLDGDGDRILVVEARGDLTIAIADRILRRVHAALAQGRLVIIDMKSVTGMDAGSVRLLTEFGAALAIMDETVMLTEPLETGVFDLLRTPEGELPGRFLVEQSLDQALEIAEDRVLRTHLPSGSGQPLPVESATLFSGVVADDLAALIAAIRPEARSYAIGDGIVRQGEQTDAIYVVAAGMVTVQLPSKSGTPTRVTSLGPSAIFGEMGLVDGAPRSADIVAETEAVCWRLPIDRMRAFLQENPRVMNQILTNLVGDLSDRLRQSNRMVMSLR